MVTARILRLRRLLFVHSTLYYRFDTSILSDAQFDRWAYELAELQRTYPNESAAVTELYEAFADWDGTTGYHLRDVDAWAQRKATQLIEYTRGGR